MTVPARTLKLLTFAPMVDSETTRLLCRWYGIAFAEADHLFGWVSLLTLLHGGYGRVPLLYGKGLHLSGPRPVVDRYDSFATPTRRLLPDWPDTAAVDADWQAYNGPFAIAVARFAYYHLLPERALMLPVFAGPVPRAEASIAPACYPLLRGLFTLLLGLSAPKAQAAQDHIQAVFAAVDRRLADGRPFLCGDRLTLGDIALAGAIAPLIQPPGYGAKMPSVDQMPPAIRDVIGALRSQATARHVERVYAAVAGG
jgi:glutathione S-transferase